MILPIYFTLALGHSCSGTCLPSFISGFRSASRVSGGTARAKAYDFRITRPLFPRFCLVVKTLVALLEVGQFSAVFPSKPTGRGEALLLSFFFRKAELTTHISDENNVLCPLPPLWTIVCLFVSKTWVGCNRLVMKLSSFSTLPCMLLPMTGNYTIWICFLVYPGTGS